MKTPPRVLDRHIGELAEEYDEWVNQLWPERLYVGLSPAFLATSACSYKTREAFRRWASMHWLLGYTVGEALSSWVNQWQPEGRAADFRERVEVAQSQERAGFKRFTVARPIDECW